MKSHQYFIGQNPPIFRACSQDGISEVAKPQVIGVNFKESKVVLQKYLSHFKGESWEVEHDRLAQLIYIKENLAKLLSNMPYTPPEGKSVVVLKLGKFKAISCLFLRGNENQLNIKTPKGEYVRLHWADISSETILEIMDFYLNMKINTVRIRMTGHKGKVDLADFALRMALFADWNGLTKKSLVYSEIATRYRPDYKVHVKRFLVKN